MAMRGFGIQGIGAGLCAILLAAATPSQAAAKADGPDCYDAIVSATISHQVPSILQPDPEWIVVTWPWFIDLRVHRVIEGDAHRGTLEVLSVEHTGYRSDLGRRNWWLRRNTLGGYNLIRFPNDDIQRCAPGTEGATPYLRPGPDQTLRQMRSEAEREYRRYGAH